MVRVVTAVLIQLPSREVANWYRSHIHCIYCDWFW